MFFSDSQNESLMAVEDAVNKLQTILTEVVTNLIVCVVSLKSAGKKVKKSIALVANRKCRYFSFCTLFDFAFV